MISVLDLGWPACALAVLALTAGCGASTHVAPDAEQAAEAIDPLCDGNAPTRVFVATDKGHVFAFDPERGHFARLGRLRCGSPGSPINSLAIAHDGTAFALANRLIACTFEIRTLVSQSFEVPQAQHGLLPESWAFVVNAVDGSETLYAAGDLVHDGLGFSRVDARTLKFEPPRVLTPEHSAVRMTSDDQGNIHMLLTRFNQLPPFGSQHALYHMDASNVLHYARELPPVGPAPVVWWQDQFLLFQDEKVFRIDPSASELHEVAEIPNGEFRYEAILAAATVNCGAQHVTDLRRHTEDCMDTRSDVYFLGCRDLEYQGIVDDKRQCGSFGFSTECATYGTPLMNCREDAHCTPLSGVPRVCRRGTPQADAAELAVCVVPCASGSGCPDGQRCVPDVPGFGEICMDERPFPALELP